MERYGGRGGFERSFAPVKVGQELDVTIEAVGEKGDGIAKVKGFVLFVPNTHTGEQCKIKVTRVLSKVGFAEKIGEASQQPQGAAEEAPQQEEEDQKQYEDTTDFGEE